MASLGGSAAPGAYRPPRTWRVITICGSAATMGSMNQASGGKEQHKSPGRGPRHVPRSKEAVSPLQGGGAGRPRLARRGPQPATLPMSTPPAQGCPATYPPSAPAYEAPATQLKPLPAAPVDLDAFRIRRRDLAGGVIHTYAQVA